MSRLRWLLLLLLLPATVAPAELHPEFFIRPCAGYQIRLTGLASYYLLEGRVQANGRRHRGHRLTAAHRHYDFGDTLVVTRLDNGRSVVVVCTDRLGKNDPQDRIVDLSRRAAKELGMLREGVTPVSITAKKRDSDILRRLKGDGF